MNPREPKAVLFRCDGTESTGLGHVSRCLALAEACVDRGLACVFFGQFDLPAQQLIDQAGFTWRPARSQAGAQVDLQETRAAAEHCFALAAVLDSYSIGEDYLASIDDRTLPTLVIDDFAQLERYACWGVLNFTVGAEQRSYDGCYGVRFLGPQYLPVRRALREWRSSAVSMQEKVRRVMVAVGGVDRSNLTGRIVSVLQEIATDLHVTAVVGGSYEHAAWLGELLGQFGSESRLVIQAPHLAEVYRWADVCVCGGGLTKYEAAYLGLPSVVVSQTAEQAEETGRFAGLGLTYDLGEAASLSDEQLRDGIAALLADGPGRTKLHEAGLAMFAGQPSQDPAQALTQLVGAATPGDPLTIHAD